MNSKVPTIRVTKIDAARSQLETAVTLWFTGGDPVSIHTLAWASREVLRAISKHNGKGTMLLDDDLVQPQFRKRFYDAIAKPANFFKHGNRDSAATFDFPHEFTDAIMLDAVTKYRELTRDNLTLFVLFLVYMAHIRPELFRQPFLDGVRQLLAVEDFGQTRQEFYKIFERTLNTRNG